MKGDYGVTENSPRNLKLPFLRGKIIVIDDDPDIVSLVISTIRKQFKDHPLEIYAADSGLAGLELIRREQPDLVILDIVMRDMDGIKVLEKIRTDPDKRLARTAIIMLTVKRDIETVIQAIHTGATDYLVKPFKAEELLSRIRKLFLDKRSPSG